MSFNQDNVKKIAHLARIGIDTSDFSKELAKDLEKIVTMVEHVNKVNTDHISPMAHPLSHLTQRMREDEITEPNNREALQAISPAVEAGLFLVPQVIE